MKPLNNTFIIIIPTFNAASTFVDTFQSIVQQNFDDVGIIIRDDMSTDDTPILIESLLGIDGVSQTYTQYGGRDLLYIRNTSKYYGGGNTYDSTRSYVHNKQAIIGVVDGDDKLLVTSALQKIYHIYQKMDMWLVWSQHQAASRSGMNPAGYSAPLPDDKVLYQNRKYWAVSHFRTCRAWLFDHLDRQDLRDPFTGDAFCAYAADAAFIYPLIELCGNDKSFFLDEILYWYNDELTTNEHNKDNTQVAMYTDFIRHQQRVYTPIRSH